MKRGAAVPAKRRAARSGWLAEAAAKVPTRWVSAAIGGVLLVATAAFGGLEPVEAAGPAELRAGEAHAGPMVSLAVGRAVLIDDFTEAGASADAAAGERVLSLVVDAENRSARPVHTLTSDFGEVIRLEPMLDLALEGAARLDDATIGPVLQPGVPAELVLSWIVPADAFAEGDELRVAIFDHELRVGASVLHGEYWDAPRLAAVATIELEDVGAGADAEQP